MTIPASTIHKAECDVWDMPRADSMDRLHPQAGRDAVTDRYLAQIAPAYDLLARGLAQLSGVFLLALTRDGQGPGLHLDHPVYTVALDQMIEAREIIALTTAPAPARRHRDGLVALAARLSDAAQGMDRLPARSAAVDREAGTREVLRHLAAAQALLIATAEPDAGITPVDFDHACCSCAPIRAGQ